MSQCWSEDKKPVYTQDHQNIHNRFSYHLKYMKAEILIEKRSLESLDADGVPEEMRVTDISADLRYHGQAFELLVP